MLINFSKYQATGNDFVMIDNRQNTFPKNDTKIIAHLCDRKFGIGADGLILLENDSLTDFRMIYYNADGNQSTMCGNGGRAIVVFAATLGLIESKTEFEAIDGKHQATLLENNTVSLKMIDVNEVNKNDNACFLNTGSPHHVTFVDDVLSVNVFENGKMIRNDVYGKEGANVNFVQKVADNHIKIRTYERGVEDETLSCGTGATASAIAFYQLGLTNHNNIIVEVMGGQLQVSFDYENNQFNDVHLIGPANKVFDGTINI